ncbi:MAG: peptidyl-prolyl cis-trans isomerase [candidate division Zixibacteria bacterium]|nr:peptidyl-prolyl cis-trans isomerase [candidate division Zixibacteria bacterium]
MTLGQYLTTIRGLKRQYSSIASPDFDQHDSLASFIFQLNIADILALDARKKGLANDAEYKRKIKRFRELAMANIMENDSIPVAGAPDDGEMRQYYESHQDEFKVPAKIHIYEIMFPNEKMAADYRPKIHSLTKFKEIAGQFTERPGKRTSGGDLGYIEEQYYPDIFKLAQAAVIGDITGPIPVGGKFSLIYVADKKAEEIKDFLAVKPAIQENLEKERKQKAFTDWVAIKKLEVSIKIFEDNLKATIDKSKYAPADTTGRG